MVFDDLEERLLFGDDLPEVTLGEVRVLRRSLETEVSVLDALEHLNSSLSVLPALPLPLDLLLHVRGKDADRNSGDASAEQAESLSFDGHNKSFRVVGLIITSVFIATLPMRFSSEVTHERKVAFQRMPTHKADSSTTSSPMYLISMGTPNKRVLTYARDPSLEPTAKWSSTVCFVLSM